MFCAPTSTTTETTSSGAYTQSVGTAYQRKNERHGWDYVMLPQVSVPPAMNKAPTSGGNKSHQTAIDTDLHSSLSYHCPPPGYGPVTYQPESGRQTSHFSPLVFQLTASSIRFQVYM